MGYDFVAKSKGRTYYIECKSSVVSLTDEESKARVNNKNWILARKDSSGKMCFEDAKGREIPMW